MLKFLIIIVLIFISIGYRRYASQKRREIRDRRQKIMDRLKRMD